MQPDPSKIRALLKKTQHHDKDERYMATSDLTGELNKIEGDIDSSLQTPIRDAILKQLDDNSNDVQSVACRCLCSIVQKFVCEQVEEIVDKLGLLLVNGRKSELRDIYCIALKNIIAAVPEHFGHQICKKIIKRLLQGLVQENKQNWNKEEERNEFHRLMACLDILKDLTVKFGFLMTQKEHSLILENIEAMLTDSRPEIRKKVAFCLGAIVSTINDHLFNALIQKVIHGLNYNYNYNDDQLLLFTFIQTVAIFARNAGQRVCRHLNAIVPPLMSICCNCRHDAAAMDLRENCLQTFDVMVTQCPTQMLPHSKKLINVALTMMTYDPNYDANYDDIDIDIDDNDNDNDIDIDIDIDIDSDSDWGDPVDWEENENENDLIIFCDSDLDDRSWKVRRAAIKMLISFISRHKSKCDLLPICDLLLSRFGEHDTTVRLDIFKAFQELISIICDNSNGKELICDKLAAIMQQICKQFGSKSASTKVKNGLLAILRDLLVVGQANMAQSQYFKDLILCIMACMRQNNDIQLKQSSVCMLYLILTSGAHNDIECLSVIDDDDEALCAAVICCIDCIYPAVKRRAMLIVSRMAEILYLKYNIINNKYDAMITDLFCVTFKQLNVTDICGEAEKAALVATTAMISRFGDNLLSSFINPCINILNERLANEITRETALECFSILAKSTLNIDMSSIVNCVVESCCLFLKESGCAAAAASNTLICIIGHNGNGNGIDKKLLLSLIVQCSAYINDCDLQKSALILQLMAEIIKKYDNVRLLSAITKYIFPSCYKFLQSPLLQNNKALIALKSLFSQFYLQTNGKILSFDAFKNELIRSATPKLSRSSYSAIAQCLSVLILINNNNNDMDMDIISLIDSSNECYSQVALLAIGELGKAGLDLGEWEVEQLNFKIFCAFNSEWDCVKWAASFALGNICIGNMELYLPALLRMLHKHGDQQYLLLNSLREIITYYCRINKIMPFGQRIRPLLFCASSSSDEGVRALIAECLGKLAVIDAESDIFVEIERLLCCACGNTRATMATAIKYCLNTKALPSSVIDAFLLRLSDENLLVRRQTFLSLNRILRVNCGLIDVYQILHTIYCQTVTNVALIREVDLGPFKHCVDEGLSLRKAAFICLDSLIDATPHMLDLFEFISFLRNGLCDSSADIQMLTYQIFYKIGTFHSNLIMLPHILDSLPTDLMKGMKEKMDQTKGNKDCERAKDILRAACKALYTLRNVPNINKARKFVTFYSRVEKTKLLIPMLTELKNQAPKHSPT